MVEHVDGQVGEQRSASNGDQGPVIVVDATCMVPPQDCPKPGVNLGRIKSPPVCIVPELKKEATSSQQLAALCFPQPGIACSKVLGKDAPSDGFSSSSSSASGEASSGHLETTTNRNGDSKLKLQTQTSAILNAKVYSRKTSRQGRSTQRWATDSKTNQTIRLVTGCVPIMKDGRILFVTASRKNEWILPKGGWEIDETMEESAIRETFEEAGVLGTLGPRLSEIEYETRKAKKRRLELEEVQRKSKKERSESDYPSGCSDHIHSSEDEHQPVQKVAMHCVGDSLLPEEEKTNKSKTSVEAVAPIPVAQKTESCDKHFLSDETSSLASDSSSTHSFVRMTLFPLYVSEAKDSWPESGRFRKLFDIDEAIEMLDSRPEFRIALMEVKEKGLHLV